MTYFTGLPGVPGAAGLKGLGNIFFTFKIKII